MQVMDVMTRPVLTVRTCAPLRAAGVPLTKYHYSAVPVIDEDERLAGVLTSGDLLRAGHADGPVTAAEAMTAPAVTVGAGDDLNEVIALLVQHGLRSIPVVDDDGLVLGIVSRGDVLRLRLTADDAVAVGVQKRLDDYTGRRRWIANVQSGAVAVSGVFLDESERRIAAALARTVPGVRTADVVTTTHPVATGNTGSGT